MRLVFVVQRSWYPQNAREVPCHVQRPAVRLHSTQKPALPAFRQLRRRIVHGTSGQEPLAEKPVDVDAVPRADDERRRGVGREDALRILQRRGVILLLVAARADVDVCPEAAHRSDVRRITPA